MHVCKTEEEYRLRTVEEFCTSRRMTGMIWHHDLKRNSNVQLRSLTNFKYFSCLFYNSLGRLTVSLIVQAKQIMDYYGIVDLNFPFSTFTHTR